MDPVAFYFGEEEAIGGIFPFSLGVEPSVCVMRMVSGVSLPKCGTISIRQSNQSVTFPECLLASHSRQGIFNDVRFLDRRWKWRGGSISMEHNIPVGGGPTILNERTPQQIAAALLEAMGESNHVVSQMPNDPRPHVKWDAVEPKLALDALCRVLGCRPGIDPITNRATIYKIGTGPTTNSNFDIHIPDELPAGYAPAFVSVVFGPTIYQARLKLEAITLDEDENYRSLPDDQEVSSVKDAPAPWVGFPSLASDADVLERAVRSAYRTYRITGTEDGLSVPGFGSINSVDDILPILPRLTTVFDSIDNYPAGADYPYVEGKFWTYENCGVTHSSTARYPLPFAIDQDAGIVHFRHPVFKTESDGTPSPCDELYLVAAFHVRAPSGLLDSSNVSVATGVPCAGGTFPIRQTGYFRTYNSLTGEENSISQHGQSLATVTAQQWANFETSISRRLGLETIGPNGNIWQVCWSAGSYVADRIATTTIGIRCEPVNISGTYEHKRNQSRAAAMADWGGI